LNTDFSGDGHLDNLIGFVMQHQPLTGTLNLAADKLNLNEWMGTDTTTTAASTTSSDPFIVPSNIDLTINAKADKVKYDKVDYKNINGTLLLADETVKLQNVKTDALDGTMTLNGSYSTKTNKKEPAININYDVKDVNVQKAFYAFNTIQRLMPIGQFLDGKLHSQLTMTGNLDGNMMPDLNTLSGKGNLLLVEGLLRKFAPLEKLAATLQIDRLKSITIKDVKQYIEFANGKVLVKPFIVKINDIEMQIGGLHGLDQTIDYAVQMKVPRKYLGSEGNNLLDNLAMKASNKGVPVKLGEIVNLNIKMAGSFTNPTIKTELKEVAGDAMKEMQQQAVDFAKAKVDTVKQTVKDTLSSVKKQLVNDAKDQIKDKIFGTKDSSNANNIDSTKKRTGETIKNTLKGLLKRKNQPADSTKKN
jgi:gas vesicle protein